jgi:hypothetical protein
MSSHGAPTRVQSPPAPKQEAGVDLQTLVITAVASAAAAYITSKVWARGTLWSAAMTPVIVAVVKEALRKPTEVVTAAVPIGGRQRTRESAALPSEVADQLHAGAPPPLPPPQPGAEEGPVRVYSTRSRRLRWRLAVITGLLGFLVCVVVYTVPEVIAGGSVARPGHGTTFFSGSTKHTTSKRKDSTVTTPTTTATTPAQTQTQPAQTVTQTVTTPAAPPAQSTTTPPAAGAPQTTTPETTTPQDGTAPAP